MAIPVITDHYLAMVVIPLLSADDEGGVTNTWFFRNDAIGGTSQAQVAINIGTVLQAFYSNAFGTGGKSVSQFFSPIVDDTTGAELRVYDLGSAAPRTPIIENIGLDSQQSSTPMPNEVSIVLSYNSAPVAPNGSTTLRRRRGRLYLGPWGTGVLESPATGDGDARVDAETIDTIQLAAQDVLGTTEDVTWMQYSRVANVMTPVTQGFVDNAFDTQRRRGLDPTARVVWP